MSGMVLIIAAALLTGLGALAVLLWALSSGQYDDMEGDALRILNDDSETGYSSALTPSVK
jgi:cbb3-type cytochrome oxidase maturation protein